MTVAGVLEHFFQISHATLVEYRRHCCRLCYGEPNVDFVDYHRSR